MVLIDIGAEAAGTSTSFGRIYDYYKARGVEFTHNLVFPQSVSCESVSKLYELSSDGILPRLSIYNANVDFGEKEGRLNPLYMIRYLGTQ